MPIEHQRPSRHSDLLLCGGLLGVALFALAVPVPGPLLTVLGVPVALVVPGYAAMGAAFGSQQPEALTRATLTVGTSLVLLILVSVTLDAISIALDATSLTVALTVVTVPSLVVAARRQRDGDDLLAMTVRRFREVRATTVVLAVLLGIAAPVGMIVVARTTQPAVGITGDVALAATTDREGVTHISVINAQSAARTYRLMVIQDGATLRRGTLRVGPGRTARAHAMLDRGVPAEIRLLDDAGTRLRTVKLSAERP